MKKILCIIGLFACNGLIISSNQIKCRKKSGVSNVLGSKRNERVDLTKPSDSKNNFKKNSSKKNSSKKSKNNDSRYDTKLGEGAKRKRKKVDKNNKVDKKKLQLSPYSQSILDLYSEFKERQLAKKRRDILHRLGYKNMLAFKDLEDPFIQTKEQDYLKKLSAEERLNFLDDLLKR
jgi:hypothetical protein